MYNDDNYNSFIETMTQISPELQYVSQANREADAIYFAMNNVTQFEGPKWFGSIGNGIFYADTNDYLWLPDTAPPEAISIIATMLGEAMTDNLNYI